MAGGQRGFWEALSTSQSLTWEAACNTPGGRLWGVHRGGGGAVHVAAQGSVHPQRGRQGSSVAGAETQPCMSKGWGLCPTKGPKDCSPKGQKRNPRSPSLLCDLPCPSLSPSSGPLPLGWEARCGDERAGAINLFPGSHKHSFSFVLIWEWGGSGEEQWGAGVLEEEAIDWARRVGLQDLLLCHSCVTSMSNFLSLGLGSLCCELGIRMVTSALR